MPSAKSGASFGRNFPHPIPIEPYGYRKDSSRTTLVPLNLEARPHLPEVGLLFGPGSTRTGGSLREPGPRVAFFLPCLSFRRHDHGRASCLDSFRVSERTGVLQKEGAGL